MRARLAEGRSRAQRRNPGDVKLGRASVRHGSIGGAEPHADAFGVVTLREIAWVSAC